MREEYIFFFLRKILTFKIHDDQEESRSQPDGDNLEIVFKRHHGFSRQSFEKPVRKVPQKTMYKFKHTNSSSMMRPGKRILIRN